MKTIEHCSKCNAEIVWVKTKKGRPMPVNAETVDDFEKEYRHGKHISHFATCRFASDFRKPR